MYVGHTSAPHGGVCIDLSRMQSVKVVHSSDLDCVVEAGLSWNNLNAELKHLGLFFPVDPGPGASIGGMVGTSCSGTNAVRHGTMKHNVLNLTVVMPDGSVVKTGNRARKSSAGYDLTRLFIGSEGTLGIVTEVTLRLQPLPESIAVATCTFDSIRSAAEATMVLSNYSTTGAWPP
jgi:D-lactate dehydrogenase (cytochrome)